ncbi:hypothetical protein KIF53_15915 [Chromobacterium subtsugae]|uniref:XRE family transcriptional regulator n=1 Tax=Chromobacterium subtsugae TaxID=251747 RepID=A0ABS7FI14_9NEIS|nr:MULTISPECIES: hypothetical protein [Chromobacterium]KUM01924.1 hypothetical protein Cv017_05825 [Chromobacterium subtsugae]KZE84895.1 hypothetical protein AWB61_02650 [Chromobacterium sp. F49]MBW7567893.1 hypothetical protein [Chromobacterium subtsugae]MBW8289120.1 hypothetical protein [Chromobacterium subtsugae]OBU85435.1 hypothetical protein MY55_16650 [Chromobacterium subtsugae]
MAEHKKKSAAPKAGQLDRRVQEQRHGQAEDACRRLVALLEALAADGRLDGNQQASQYLNSTRAYYRRIRNGKVMGAADFTAAADVCACARRALAALDPELVFAGLPQADELLQALRLGEQVETEMRRIKAAGKAG